MSRRRPSILIREVGHLHPFYSQASALINLAQRSAVSKHKRFVREQRSQIVDTPFGQFVVILTHRQLLLSPELLPNGTCVGQKAVEVIATIKKMPNESTLQEMITTYVHQRMITNGHHSLYPSISVGVTLPKEHPIWDIMQYSDLTGLVDLLNQGKASLRSYNEDGVPLLNVRALESV